MKCKLIFNIDLSQPDFGGRGTAALCRCHTHNFDLGVIQAQEGMLCPLGRIEEATEDGLAKIAAATANITQTETK